MSFVETQEKKVGPMPANQVMILCRDLLKDDKQIQSLDVLDVVQASKDARDALATMLVEVEAWKLTGSLDEKIAKVNSLISEYKCKFNALLDYWHCMEPKLADLIIQAQRSLRGKRDGIASKHTDHTEQDCPDSLAKHFSQLVIARENRFDTISSSPHSMSEFNEKRQAYPQCLNVLTTDGVLQRVVRGAIETAKPALTKAAQRMSKAIEKQTKTHASASVDCLSNNGEMTRVLDCKFLDKTIVITQICGAYQASLDNVILPGVGCVISCSFGYCHVLVLSLEHVIADGHSFETVQIYLDGLDAATLAKSPSFGLKENTSVIVPFGFVPIVIGLPGTDNDAVDYNSYVVQYFIREDEATAHLEVRAEVEGCITKAVARSSKYLEANRDLLKKWVCTWQYGSQEVDLGDGETMMPPAEKMRGASSHARA